MKSSRVSYFYDRKHRHGHAYNTRINTYTHAYMSESCLADVGNYHYGPGHPMKPHRIRMANSLLVNYGLFKKLDVCRPPRAGKDDMTKFHSDDYVSFLNRITPQNMLNFSTQLQRCQYNM